MCDLKLARLIHGVAQDNGMDRGKELCVYVGSQKLTDGECGGLLTEE